MFQMMGNMGISIATKGRLWHDDDGDDDNDDGDDDEYL